MLCHIPQSNMLHAMNRSRKLLQPTQHCCSRQMNLARLLTQSTPGLASVGASIRRISTACKPLALLQRKSRKPKIKKPGDAFTSGEAMADYAGKLFDFGHEAERLSPISKFCTNRQRYLKKTLRSFGSSPNLIWVKPISRLRTVTFNR